MSRLHTQRFFEGCQNRQPVNVAFCRLDGYRYWLDCAEELPGMPERFFQLTWVQAMGYVCLSADDFQVFSDWCMR
jgi:hypothetical protein